MTRKNHASLRVRRSKSVAFVRRLLPCLLASPLAMLGACSSSNSPASTTKDAGADGHHVTADASQAHDAGKPSHEASIPDATPDVASSHPFEAGADAPAVAKDASISDANSTHADALAHADAGDAAAIDAGVDAAPPPLMCPPSCANGHACTGANQCASGVCTAGVCASPSCAPDCTNSSACGSNSDCLWSLCSYGSCASAPNCAALLAANPSAPSGLYQIAPAGTDGGTVVLVVYCDMVSAGGGWTQVVDQDVAISPGYQTLPAWRNGVNITQPNSGQYSILYDLPILKSGTNYELRIDWPTAPEAGSVQWTQVDNPNTAPDTPTISNVVMSPLNQGGCGTFRGLGPSLKGQPSALNGDSANDSACWWWGIGTSAPYSSAGGIPSFDNGPQGGLGTPHARLWVR